MSPKSSTSLTIPCRSRTHQEVSAEVVDLDRAILGDTRYPLACRSRRLRRHHCNSTLPDREHRGRRDSGDCRRPLACHLCRHEGHTTAGDYEWVGEGRIATKRPVDALLHHPAVREHCAVAGDAAEADTAPGPSQIPAQHVDKSRPAAGRAGDDRGPRRCCRRCPRPRGHAARPGPSPRWTARSVIDLSDDPRPCAWSARRTRTPRVGGDPTDPVAVLRERVDPSVGGDERAR